MKEYRDHAKNTPGTDTHLLARQSSGAPEKWHTLDQQFGLDDMYELEADQEDQTIKQEYQSYVTGVLSKLGTDMIKFWDVDFLTFCRLVDEKRWIDRLVKRHSLRSLPYQWTISLYKRH